MNPQDWPPSIPKSESAYKMWELLIALQSRKTPMSLSKFGDSVGGSTLILAADPDRELLLLDALREPDAPIAAGDRLYLETQIDGRRLGFNCRVQEAVELHDGKAYLAEQPTLVLDETGRAAYRVQVPQEKLLEFDITERDLGRLPAQVLDISRHGMGAQLPAQSEVADGVRVHCSLDLPDVKVFVEATVRHARTADDGVRVGLQFSEIAPVIQAELNRAVLQLERQLSTDKTAPGTPAEPEPPAQT
jgi:c-di-GMP-binding flagellar brake protein YcgR